VCSAGSRILVQRAAYDDVLSAMVERAAAIRIGSGLDPTTTMGPLVSDEQLARVRSYVDIGVGEGARLVHQGAAPTDPTLVGGYFHGPTIFDTGGSNDPNSFRIAQEEIFGPVATVIPFDDTDDAIRIANDTPYGLAAAIWTSDIGTALRTARAVRAGVVWINDSQPAPSETMWGGFKQSGIGRELGPYALDAYLERKQIYIRL
jgi:acyl-CoA reductase-like NAD-dependent aldehyde dehydrogenase